MPKIYYHSEKIDFTLKNQSIITKWTETIIQNHQKITGNIAFVFCSDEYLLQVNKEYLQHDYYTDIITFDYTEKGIISGDIFISIDRIKENAQEFNTSFSQELNRVLIHGILHLLGYKDKSQKQKKQMTEKEDECLALLNQITK